MKLNGWQRIWVILAVPWLIFVILRVLDWVVVRDRSIDNKTGGEMLLYLIAPFGVYILVLLTRRLTLWVIEGFRDR